MKNKSVIVWSFVVFMMLSGCGPHGKLASIEPGVNLEPPQDSATRPKGLNTTGELEDEAGYKLRPLEIEMKAGKPYLPVGAAINTKAGKVPLQEVIKVLAGLKGLSVTWADDVKPGELVDPDIRPEDDFWDALDNILRQLDYFYEVSGNTIVLKYKETKNYYLSMPSLSEEFSTTIGGDMLPDTGGEGAEAGLKAEAELTIESAEFKFWDDVEKALSQIVKCSDCPEPIIDRVLGMITLSAPKQIHKDVEKYLSLLETEAYKQVVIEAKIIEVALSEQHETGVDWSNIFKSRKFSGQVRFGSETEGLIWNSEDHFNVGDFLREITITSPEDWEGVVSAFEEYGDTTLISNPKINLLNGHGAVLSAGEQTVYLTGCNVTTTESGVTTSSPEIGAVTQGLTMGVKANIMGDDEVILYLFPAITRLLDLKNISNTNCGVVQAPETSVREMATFAKVKDRELLIIGGLIQKRDQVDNSKVPILGDIPLLGKAFQYESSTELSTELVIIIKPRILPFAGAFAERTDWIDQDLEFQAFIERSKKN
ncbi:MAG: hypothetical protein SV775_11730 [Thermodesulfobacteriota bacterium]|nr:hypothetical protein [Thermodesulfobacteriota bacterium]